MPEEQTFVKRLAFKFVRKRIAGATLNSALETTKELNSRGMSSTITFLNDHVRDGIKARYNLNSYLQLTKQVSRLNLKSGISVRLSQLGFNISEGMANKGLEDLLSVAHKSGVHAWLEHESAVDTGSLLDAYSSYHETFPNTGIELPLRSSHIAEIVRGLPRRGSLLKLTAHSYGYSKGKARDPVELYTSYARKLGKSNSVYILENDEKTLYAAASRAGIPKSNLIVELPLGCSSKWLKRFAKRRLSMGVYVPYGKDWVPYAINRLTEGRIRSIAMSVLNGETSGSYAR